MYLLFIVYLYFINYFNTNTEYITLVLSLCITSFVMYYYEKIKKIENNILTNYTNELKSIIEIKTSKLEQINQQLQTKINNELEKRISHEKFLLKEYSIYKMSEIISKLSHQLKQPLMLINSILLNMTKEENNENKKIEELCKITSNMSKSVENMDYILNYNNKEMHKIKIKTFILNIIDLLKDDLKDVNIVINSNGISFYNNKNNFTQVIVIILSKCLLLMGNKFNKITIDIKNENNYICLNIIIDNLTLCKSDLKNIFEPYYTSSINDDGFSMFMCKIIIEHKMNSTIEVINKKNALVFKLKLRDEQC